MRKAIRQSTRRLPCRRQKENDNASSLAAAVVAAAERAEAKIEAVEIGVLESKARERSQRRCESSFNPRSKGNIVKLAIEGEMETFNILPEEDEHQKRKNKFFLKRLYRQVR